VDERYSQALLDFPATGRRVRDLAEEDAQSETSECELWDWKGKDGEEPEGCSVFSSPAMSRI